MCTVLCILFYAFLKYYPKKGSIGSHRLPKAPMARKRLKTLGRPSNARRYKVNPGWHAREGTRCEAALISPALLLLPIPEDPLQHHNPFSLNSFQRKRAAEINVRRQQGVQLHHPEPPSEGLTPTEHRPHLSTHLIINAPPHPTAHSATIFGNHGNHSTHQGQAELWATQGHSQFCPFKPHS